MGRAGSPIYKGKPRDYDLPFVRSFQLFCPIKISIFSPIAATRGFAFCSVARSPAPAPLPLSTHATLHTVASTVPNPTILPLSPSPILLYSHRFLPIALLSISPLPFVSLLCLRHLRHSDSNIQLLATRTFAKCSQKAGNEVAYGFCVHTNG